MFFKSIQNTEVTLQKILNLKKQNKTRTVNIYSPFEELKFGINKQWKQTVEVLKTTQLN